MEAIEKWAKSEGYAIGDTSIWDLKSVPKGDKLGQVRQDQAWKPSQFDRWRMTWHGLERVSPHLVIETISSDQPVETIVNISYGSTPKNPEIRESWQSLLQSAASAIKQAAATAARVSEPSAGPAH